MKCAICGREYDDYHDLTVCECGGQLIPDNQKPEKTDSSTTNENTSWIGEDTVETGGGSSQTEDGTSETGNDHKKKNTIILIIVVTGILIISGGITVWWLLNRKPPVNPPVTTIPPYNDLNDDESESTTGSVFASEGTSVDIHEKEESSTTEKSAETTMPVQVSWSSWMDSLPSYVNADNYTIETQILYRSRDLETTSSNNNTMIGWELYNTVTGNGNYGAWSSWSQDVAKESDNREVQTEKRYRYSDKETTTGSSSSKSGWTLEDTIYSWGDYGSWSNWSTTPVAKSDSRKVESKTQYRYRDITSSTSYSDWSNWSDWSPDYVSANDTTDVQTATIYGYYYFHCPGCGTRWHGWAFNCAGWGGGGCGTYIPESTWHQMWSDVSWDQAGLQDFHGTGKYVTYYFGDRWFKWNDNGTPRTGYRYRTRTTSEKKNYGSWSGWSDTVYSASSTREVEKQTVYRYCDRSKVETYHFYRWTDWSSWSTNPVSQSNTRKVETAVFYRYRDRVSQTTYYFRRWKDWSSYSKTPAYESDTRQVETKTQYRYKSK